MTDLEIEKLLPGPGNAWNDDLYPVRVPGMEQYLHDGMLRLTCKTSGQVHELDQAEGIIWALADGEQNLASIRKKFHQLSAALPADTALQLDSAVGRLADEKLLIFNQSEAFTFPVEINDFTHIVTTRGGLYLVNKERYLQIERGMYFGICYDNQGDLLVYDFPHKDSSLWQLPFNTAKKAKSDEGVIKRLKIADGMIHAPLVHTTNLANNCHYIAWHEDSLFVVDCEGQQVNVIDQQGRRRDEALFSGTYYHINTIALIDHHYWVLKCLGRDDSLFSSVGVFDKDWQQVADLPLKAERAHDLYFESGSTVERSVFWVCDSQQGFLVRYPDGKKLAVRTAPSHGNATRGLNLSGDQWITGSGFLGSYYRNAAEFRHRGIIQWLQCDSGKLLAELSIPEAPCCILALLQDD